MNVVIFSRLKLTEEKLFVLSLVLVLVLWVDLLIRYYIVKIIYFIIYYDFRFAWIIIFCELIIGLVLIIGIEYFEFIVTYFCFYGFIWLGIIVDIKFLGVFWFNSVYVICMFVFVINGRVVGRKV